MKPESGQILLRTDYDIWECAKCGRKFKIPALPHRPPVCCGTGTWYRGSAEGDFYEYIVP